MKILFVLHPSFVSNSDQLGWVKNLCAELNKSGLQVEIFEFENHKISDFSAIHLFGFGYFDLFFQLKKSGKRTICTPSMASCEKELLLSRLIRNTLILLHIIKQRTTRPLDVYSMIRSFDRYVFANSTSSSWRKRWKLNSERLHEFNFYSKEFPTSLIKLYEEIHH